MKLALKLKRNARPEWICGWKPWSLASLSIPPVYSFGKPEASWSWHPHLQFYLFSAVYRTIELADGWTGKIISTQLYFSAPCHSSAFVSSDIIWQMSSMAPWLRWQFTLSMSFTLASSWKGAHRLIWYREAAPDFYQYSTITRIGIEFSVFSISNTPKSGHSRWQWLIIHIPT